MDKTRSIIEPKAQVTLATFNVDRGMGPALERVTAEHKNRSRWFNTMLREQDRLVGMTLIERRRYFEEQIEKIDQEVEAIRARIGPSTAILMNDTPWPKAVVSSPSFAPTFK